MENPTHRKEIIRLSLNPVFEGLKVGIRKNNIEYSVRDDRGRFFYPEEWFKFINAIKPDYRILFESLIQTGGRIKEVLNIKPMDFDFQRNNITLRVTKIKAKKKEKVGKPRTFPVSSQYCRKIRAFIKEYNHQDNEILFDIHKNNVWRMMRLGLVRAGFKDYWNFGLHNIRKTHGNYLKALEIPAEEICLRLGHDFNTYLKHYGSPNIFNRQDKQNMIRILGDVYGFK